MSKKTIKKEETKANVKTKVEEKKETVIVAEAKIAEPKKVEVSKAEPKKVVAKKVAVKKPVAKPEVIEAKKEPKKIATKKAPEKITAKAEPKKITTAKAPEKIAVAKAPEKIAAKPEPKKIATKKVEKVETKKAAIEKPAVKAEVKKETEKPVKSTTKKTTVKKAVKKEVEPVKKETVKKPVVKTKSNNEKLEKLQSLSLEECIAYMQAMNVQYVYEDYHALLLDESDLKVLEKNIVEGNHIKDLHVKFEEVGYDEDLVMVTLTKVAETMDIKAMDYKDLKQSINQAIKFKFNKDGEVNAAQYLDEFKISEKLLMIGQRKNIVNTADITALIGADVAKFYQHFFSFAYELLPQWQYNDVKFYEDFAYAVLSQFADLYESDQLRVQMDIADLYIKHGDYAHGDDMYGYILRDNQIKDYIYYRYASIYKDIDFNKARSIAYSSLQCVDDRFQYYTDIMKIINQ